MLQSKPGVHSLLAKQMTTARNPRLALRPQLAVLSSRLPICLQYLQRTRAEAGELRGRCNTLLRERFELEQCIRWAGSACCGAP
jgi:hypothetical protein